MGPRGQLPSTLADQPCALAVGCRFNPVARWLADHLPSFVAAGEPFGHGAFAVLECALLILGPVELEAPGLGLTHILTSLL